MALKRLREYCTDKIAITGISKYVEKHYRQLLYDTNGIKTMTSRTEEYNAVSDDVNEALENIKNRKANSIDNIRMELWWGCAPCSTCTTF